MITITKQKLISFAWFIFVLGITLDIISTGVGMFLGIEEGNPVGFLGVYIGNLVVLVAAYFAIPTAKKLPFWFTFPLPLVLGVFRIVIFFHNLVIIGRYLL